MDAVDVAVGVENKFPAVAMALPFRDYFHINAKLDCASGDANMLATSIARTRWRLPLTLFEP